jgi:hypothetical protein
LGPARITTSRGGITAKKDTIIARILTSGTTK